MTITTSWRGVAVLLLLAASAVAAETNRTPVDLPVENVAGTPVAEAPLVGGQALELPGDAAGRPCPQGCAGPGWTGNQSDCFSCCTFCERISAPPDPCNPDWFPVGRITCRSPPHRFWYGEVGVVGLYRDAEPSGQNIATLGPGGDVVMSSSQAYPDFRAGGMVRLGRMFTPTWGIEYGYLGTASWNGDAAVRDQTANAEGGLGNLFSPFGDFGVTPVDDFDYNELVSISGRSQFDSYELNLRQRLHMPPEPLQVSVFYGIRYINLDERFGYYSQSQVPLPGGATQSANVRAINDLFGAQLGTLLELHVEPRWWIDARLAAALYNNRAVQRTNYEETGAVPSQNFLENSNQRGTVGAEASVACAYAVRQNLTIRFGYQFLWFDRVALATENFETNPALLRNGPAQLDTTGTIMYHGPFLGATMTW